jgi:hypothetical protein
MINVVRQSQTAKCTLLSMVLCACATSLWIRSVFRCDAWKECDRLSTGNVYTYRFFEAHSGFGRIQITRSMCSSIRPELVSQLYGISESEAGTIVWTTNLAGSPSKMQGFWKSVGFEESIGNYYDIASKSTIYDWSVTFPYWIIVCILLLLPLRWGYKRYTKSRPGIGQRCSTCDYNLTGNISGMCPECGAACKAADPAGASPAAGN